MPIESHRKLAAILSADAVGYSRLMAADEAATVETLKSYREIITRLVMRHGGRVINAPGDALLAEFPSAVEAVQAAVEVQKSLEGHNIDLEAGRRMQFRIGVNLGDVIEEADGTIYGDGVNIAARMEALAEAGGVCISSTIYDAVEGKLSFGFDYLGEQQVKNISKPVRVYRVRSEKREQQAPAKAARLRKWRWPALAGFVLLGAVIAAGLWRYGYLSRETPEDSILALPKGPSIAVLPFVNLSGDPAQGYFADGIAEDIITELSKLRQLLVIARNSTFQYKGQSVDVRKVSRELGVRFVLEGSVRVADKRVRVTAQLVDGTNGMHLWAERYDRSLRDFFAVQDEITDKIIEALDVKLLEGDQTRERRHGTENLQAYALARRADDFWHQPTQEGNVESRRLIRQAIALDSEYAFAHVLLGYSHMADYWWGWSGDPAQSLKEAVTELEKAAEVDDKLSAAHQGLGHVYLNLRRFDEAIAEGERSVALNPNSSDTIGVFAEILYFTGQSERALPYIQTAIRLDPFAEFWKFMDLGRIYRDLGRHEKALAALHEAIKRFPGSDQTMVYLIATYLDLGRDEDARIMAKTLLQYYPNYSSEKLYSLPYKDPKTLDHYRSALRRVGMK